LNSLFANQPASHCRFLPYKESFHLLDFTILSGLWNHSGSWGHLIGLKSELVVVWLVVVGDDPGELISLLQFPEALPSALASQVV